MSGEKVKQVRIDQVGAANTRGNVKLLFRGMAVNSKGEGLVP